MFELDTKYWVVGVIVSHERYMIKMDICIKAVENYEANLCLYLKLKYQTKNKVTSLGNRILWSQMQTIGAISSRAAGSAGVQYSLQRLLSSSQRASEARHLIRPYTDNKRTEKHDFIIILKKCQGVMLAGFIYMNSWHL